jgi:hypothetical protein
MATKYWSEAQLTGLLASMSDREPQFDHFAEVLERIRPRQIAITHPSRLKHISEVHIGDYQ